MFPQLLRLLRSAFSAFIGLFVAAVLGAATLAAWHFYQEERFRGQLAARGEPVTVRIERTDRHHRQAWDALGNFVYVGFRYHGRPYEARCVSDTAWLAAGDRIVLRYLAPGDVFGQLRRPGVRGPNQGASRLLDWSAVPDFSPQTRALIAFVMAAGALFFVAGALLAALPGLGFIRHLAGAVGALALGTTAVFFTYDGVQYYRYVAELKRDSRPLEVAVLHADWHYYDYRMPISNHHRWLPIYVYDATFPFRGQQRTIPVEEADYERLKAGATRLAVRYDDARDDFVAANYSPRWGPALFPLLFWLVLGVAFRPGAARAPAVQPARF